jgi:hypothetical protein
MATRGNEREIVTIEEVAKRNTRLASLKRQLHFHHERRKLVEHDPKLTTDERADHLEYHARLVMRLLGQLIDLEGH